MCRPEPEASRLAQCFRNAGADARALPMLERAPLPETPAQRTLIQNLDRFQHVVAVSPYAAELLLALIDTWWPQLPQGLNWYGVGAGTAKVLADAGLSPQWPPQGVSSEDLLRLPVLNNIRGERVLIARGESGRELLRETLLARGAEVTAMPIYRRQAPDYSPQQLQQALGDFAPDAIIALSAETLNNFIALNRISGHNLKQQLLVLPVQRVAELAASAGYTNVCIPASLTDPEVVAAVAQRLAQKGCP
ncbi:uroporphyrinogen-III synthase [Marinobacter sp. X15-166B]|uniref:uroporphyrinogen-III synthase n=1 Tax=Marinobacter sp. X15-166B TaxID=1897620 RepID=UPI0026B66060|nr:uroporphyrinogen-III synthase [Marinobacter sp. X15-166B]